MAVTPVLIAVLRSLLAVTLVAIIANLLQGRRPECRWPGQLSSTPVSWRTMLRNVALMAAAATVVIMGTGNPEPSFGGVGRPG